jgi:transcriptional regulator with XRE-family HTH domain
MDQTLKVIKRIREDKNISREELSKILGISLSGYAKIERGEVDLTIARLTQISEILGFTAMQIIEMGSQNAMVIQPSTSPTQTSPSLSEKFSITDKDLYIQLLEQRIYELSKKLEASQ